MSDEKAPIPADDVLAALGDTELLQLLEDNGIETAGISDREATTAALQAKRDAAVSQAEAEPEPEPESLSLEQAAMVIDTRAEDEPLPEPRKTFAHVLTSETAAAFKSKDMELHAALHNFEIATGDFKRAAQAVIIKLPSESSIRVVLAAIISDL